MSKLSDMENIGPTLEQRLINAGITTPIELRKLGSKSAYVILKEHDIDACINTLYALEGAIQGIRWHDLAVDIKADLKRFADSEKK